jgi:molybdate transport system ATP-binding protein
MSGLITPDKGRVSWNSRVIFDSEANINVPIEKRNIGYVFQDARLFPHYNVKANLLYGAKGETDSNYFSNIVELLNLSNLMDRYPMDLSGGEKQRVAIARALFSEPDMLLMDEPLASLDLPRKKEVMPFLEKLAQQIEIPILYVTHSLSEILRLADHIVLLDAGSVMKSGQLEEVWDSDAMRPWQSFSEQSSLFEVCVSEHNKEYGLTKVKLYEDVELWVQHVEEAIGTSLRLQIRANDVSVALEKATNTSIRNIISAKIAEFELIETKHGNQNVSMKLDLGSKCFLRANITQWAFDELELKLGQQVFAQIKGVSVAQKDMTNKPISRVSSNNH